jgi:hypothetical protein
MRTRQLCNLLARYKVQFQEAGKTHSETDVEAGGRHSFPPRGHSGGKSRQTPSRFHNSGWECDALRDRGRPKETTRPPADCQHMYEAAAHRSSE